MQKICCVLIWRIFLLILLSNLFPVSFGVSNNFYIEIPVVLLFTLHIYQEYCISCHGSVDILCSKVMVMGSSKILRVFNFTILLKSQNSRKCDTREIYMFYSITKSLCHPMFSVSS